MSNFDIFSVRVHPERQIGLHSQETFELSYIKYGSGERTIGRNAVPFRTGELVLIPPRTAHCWMFSKNDVDSEGCIANISAMFSARLIERIAELFPVAGESINRLLGVKSGMVITGRAAQAIIGEMESLAALNEAHRPPGIVNLLIRLGEAITSAKEIYPGERMTRVEKRKDDIISFVACNYSRSVSIKDAAQHVGMNRAAFCKFFRRNFDCTFITFLNRFRIDNTRRLLASTELSVAEIAYRSGFNNLPYFNRTFKSATGLSPKAYRNAATDDQPT